jgi:hypothetical protein
LWAQVLKISGILTTFILLKNLLLFYLLFHSFSVQY